MTAPAPSTALMEITETHAAELAEVWRDPIVTKAEGISVVDDPSYQIAADFLSGEIGPALKAIHAGCDPVVSAANAAHKAATAQRRQLTDPVTAAEGIVKGKMRKFVLKREAEQRAEQERLDREHREEQERLAREQREADEAARLKTAQDLADQGRTTEAEEVFTAPPPVKPPTPPTPPPPPLARAPKAKGASARPAWKVTVTDLPAFYRGIADGHTPKSTAKPDLGALKKLVTAADGEVTYPGVYVERDVTIARGQQR